MDNVATIKEYLVTASHILSNEGLVQSHGHISARIPGTDQFLIPSHRTPGLVNFEDILTMNLSGEKVEGEGVPNSETVMHTAIYRARPDVNSVCHTHSRKAMILSAVGKTLLPLGLHSIYFSEGVALFNKPVIIVKESYAEEVAKALGKLRAIQLRGHGLIVVGPEVRRTCIENINFEEAANIQIQAMSLGDPQYFNAEDIAVYRGSCPQGPEWSIEMTIQTRRYWNYYVGRLPSQL